MLQPILNFDRQLFKLINQQWSNPFFDALMPFIRNQYTWVPLYLFFLVFVTVNFKRKAIWWFLFFIATFALTDSISQQIIKQFFERPRPCIDPLTAETARMLIPCSTGYGFVSTHATNHFGMAMFLFMTMKEFGRPWVWLFFVWAALVCYAQVYSGAHFPFDVLGGSIVGTVLGWFTSQTYTRQFGGLKHT
ncbi:MAG: phosphatase PAP2 family protein [Chitinophagaceae bacterium]|nr:phosphatase PAP2 family protein [Chitinophagaceae bacterium]